MTVVDLEAKNAKQGPTWWPRGDFVFEYDGWLYVGTGEAHFPANSTQTSAQKSALYRTDDLAKPLTLLVDFGERPFTGNATGKAPFYGSMVVLDRQLHLLTSQEVIDGHEPAWVTVDMNTWQVHLLVVRFPRKLYDPPNDRHWSYWQALRVSPRYGLIFLSGKKAYRVKLPPISEWPILPVKSSGTQPASATTTAAAEK